MTKNEIIERIAKEKMIEEIINNLAIGETKFNLDDLKQDVYLALLNKDEDKIIQLYINKQLKFYIVRMIINQLFSKTSPYYLKYKKNDKIFTTLDNEL